MFGTIATNPTALTPEERARYRAYYCGLCRELDVHFGSIGCSCLAYDTTFIALLLSSLYNLSETTGLRRCVPHPFKSHPYITTPATLFAADMNMLLAYYQCLDDWNDDKKHTAHKKSQLLEKFLPDIRARWPRQSDVITHQLALLNAMEKRNELNPDLPANCFGKLMAELFIWRRDEYEPTLRTMGAALGRYIYLMDAVNDLHSDIKKQRYNPLVAQMDTNFTWMLTMLMGECTAAFDTLPITRDKSLMQNILYSGVWQKYRVKKAKKGENTHAAGPV